MEKYGQNLAMFHHDEVLHVPEGEMASEKWQSSGDGSGACLT